MYSSVPQIVILPLLDTCATTYHTYNTKIYTALNRGFTAHKNQHIIAGKSRESCRTKSRTAPTACGLNSANDVDQHLHCVKSIRGFHQRLSCTSYLVRCWTTSLSKRALPLLDLALSSIVILPSTAVIPTVGINSC